MRIWNDAETGDAAYLKVNGPKDNDESKDGKHAQNSNESVYVIIVKATSISQSRVIQDGGEGVDRTPLFPNALDHDTEEIREGTA